MIPTWGAAFGANAIFNSAEFRADLTHSAVPDKAAPGTTATFTRATTSTWPNNDGYMVTGVAGEIGFVGARRVRNHVQTTSEDLTNTAWTTLAVAASATAANVVKATAGIGGHYLRNLGGTAVAGSVWILQAKMQAGTYQHGCLGDDGDAAYHSATFDLSAGTVTNNNAATGYIESLGGGVYLCSVIFTRTNAGSVRPLIGMAAASGTISAGFVAAGTETIIAEEIQLEDVTAQTTQTAGEYVSVGAPTDWAGDELVTNGTFDTDTTWIKESGWTIGGGAAIAATASATLYQTDTLAIGTKYVASFSVSSVSAGSVSIRIGATPLVPYDFKTAAGTYSVEFVADAVSTLVGVIGVGFTGTVDNISVKPAIYHGSMVDGVKCFPTDLSGNPIPSTTMLGYQAEGARTNLCLQSNAFTTTWAALGSPSITQDAIGPDGATSAWTITDNQSGSYYGVSQTGIAFSSGGVGCASVFIKKKLASPAYPLVIFYHRVASVAEACGLIVNEVAGTAAVISGGGYVAPTAYAVESYNSDYWRVWLSKTQAGGTLTTKLELYPAGSTDGTTLSASGQGSTVFYGMQFEIGSFPTSYIATTTLAVTRNADQLYYTGADIANLKTLSATFKRESGVESVGWAVALSDGTISNYESISAVSATQARFLGVTGGATQWDVIPSYTAGTTSKAAFSAATNDIKMAKDGVAQTQDTSATVPTVTQLNVGHVAGSFQFSGNVGGIYGWTRNLSQSELNAITA